MKKLLWIAGIIVVLAAGVFSWFYFFPAEQAKPASPAIDAVPSNAAFIIEWKNFDDVKSVELSENEIFRSLKSSELLDDVFSNYEFVNKLLSGDSLAKRVRSLPFIVSAHLSGVKKFNFLFLANLPAGADSTDIRKFLSGKLSGQKVIARSYEGVTIYEIKEQDASVFAFTVINSVFISSRSAVLAEESIRHILHGTSLRQDPGFRKIMETSKRRENGTLYLNFKNFQSFSELFLERSAAREFRNSNQFANWMGCDIKLKNDILFFNGYIFSNDTNNNYLNVFKSQKSQSISFQEYIPSNVSFCSWLGIDDLKQFSKSYFSWLENSNRMFSTQNELSKFTAGKKIRLPDDLHTFAGKEFFSFSVEKQSRDSVGKGYYFGFEVKDEEKAINYLKALRAEGTDTVEIAAGENTIIPVQLENLFSLIGLSTINTQANYFTQVGGYLIFASTPDELLAMLRYVNAGNTFKKSLVFADISDNLANEANLFMFNVPFRNRTHYNELLNENFKDEKGLLSAFSSDYSSLALQISSGKDLFYQDAILRLNPEAKKEQIPVWEGNAEEELIFVQAAGTVESNGVFCQDKEFTLYYYSSEGQLLFSKKLNGTIAAPIQLLPVKGSDPLFVVPMADELLCFSSKGIEQPGFPLKLSSKLAGAVAVFDYDNSGDPRILFGTEDGKIFNYTSKGELAKNWNSSEISTILSSAPLHIRTSKDYLVFPGSDKIVFADRRGKVIKTADTGPINPVSIRTVKSGNNHNILFSDMNGNLFILNPDKEKEKVQGIRAGKRESFMEDVDRDKRKDFLLTDTASVRLLNDSLQNIFSVQLDGIEQSELFKLKTGCYIVLHGLEQQGILDENGNWLSAFPIPAGGISFDPKSSPSAYYLIKGRKIHKFVLTGE